MLHLLYRPIVFDVYKFTSLCVYVSELRWIKMDVILENDGMSHLDAQDTLYVDGMFLNRA